MMERAHSRDAEARKGDGRGDGREASGSSQVLEAHGETFRFQGKTGSRQGTSNCKGS